MAADHAVSREYSLDSSGDFALGYDLFGIPELRRLLMFYAKPEALLSLVREALSYDPAATAEILGEELAPDLGREPRRGPLGRCLPDDSLTSLLNEVNQEIRTSVRRALRGETGCLEYTG